MKHSFIYLQLTIFVVAARLFQDHSQCYALQPSFAVRESISSSAFTYASGHLNPKTAVRASSENNLDSHDDSLDEKPILSNQGGDANNNRKSTNYFSAVQEGYRQRISADPDFISKSILEIILAATTQYMAEVSRRGRHRILPEIDFVFAGILTAVCGKYYSMWRVARTRDCRDACAGEEEGSRGESAPGASNWRTGVPTNAFQPTLLDGRTPPSAAARLLAFLLPMPQLFRAGVVASTIGYGLTSILIKLRCMLIPQYAIVTKPVSVPLVAIYTGFFMAFVSNIRYQLLQGVVEPIMIERLFGKFGAVKKVVIISVRWANGLLGSWIAIGGMRVFGLQKLV